MWSLLSGRCVGMIVMGLRSAGREECRGEDNADERDLSTEQSDKEGLIVALCATKTEDSLALAHVRTPSQIPELNTTVADR